MSNIKLKLTITDEQVIEMLRKHRWPQGVKCPYYNLKHVNKNSKSPRKNGRFASLKLKGEVDVDEVYIPLDCKGERKARTHKNGRVIYLNLLMSYCNLMIKYHGINGYSSMMLDVTITKKGFSLIIFKVRAMFLASFLILSFFMDSPM